MRYDGTSGIPETTNLQLEAEMKQYNAQLQTWVTENQQQLNRGHHAVITIPIVFHVLYNTIAENISDDEVKSRLDAMTPGEIVKKVMVD
jgi:uncharacterized protein (DUF39 family)